MGQSWGLKELDMTELLNNDDNNFGLSELDYP